MPRHPRPTRRILPALAAALSLTLLTACAPPAGDPYPAAPTRSIDTILGIDRGDDGALFDATLPERIAALVEGAAAFDGDTDVELDRAIRTGEGTKQDAEAAGETGGVETAALHVPRAATASGVPGVDVPVETRRSTTTTGSRDGREYTTTTTDTSSVRNQRETTVHDATTTVGNPDAGNGSRESIVTTQVKDACAADGEPAGTWSIEQTQTFTRPDGTLITVHITTSGTSVRNGDGTVALRNVSVVLDSRGEGPGGATAETGFRVDVDIDSWDTRGDLTDTRGRWSVGDANGVSDKDALGLAGLQLDAFKDIAYDTASRAEELRESQGVCVRLIVETDGSETLADGEQATFTARVIDPATGEEIADAVIEADSPDGAVSPATATGHGSFTFTASGDPDYRVNLSTRTDRGGDDATVRYGAAGWQFSGISYSYTVGDGIPVEIVWDGRVCGDVSNAWQLGWQIHSVASPSATGTIAPTEASEVTSGDRAILVYEEVPNPADGEPPFRLWIDDYNSGKVPAQQIIDIHPEPVTGGCTEG